MAKEGLSPDVEATAVRPTLFRGKGLFWLPIVPLVVLDLATKAWAFTHVKAHGVPVLFHDDRYREVPVFEGPVSFHLVSWHNTGTVWGLFQQNNTELIILRCLALVLICYFAWRTALHQRLQLAALALILSGAIGNLYDNFTEPEGGVRDFLLFFVGSGHDRVAFPAFNVADSCITVGALTFAFLLLKADVQAMRAARAAKKKAGAVPADASRQAPSDRNV